LEVEGGELGRSGVVALGGLVGELDAELVLELDTGEELDLELADLVLDVLGCAFEVVGAVLAHEGGDLVVEVLDLAFQQDDELEGNEDGVLRAELSLERGDLVLTLGELVLKVASLLRSEVVGLKLVSQLGSLWDQVLELLSELDAELQVEWVELLRSQAGWNVASDQVLKLVVAQSLSLSSQLRSEALKVVVALGLNLRRSESLWESGGQLVGQGLLGRQLELEEDDELDDDGVLLSG
jgi:hypothetical protein